MPIRGLSARSISCATNGLPSATSRPISSPPPTTKNVCLAAADGGEPHLSMNAPDGQAGAERHLAPPPARTSDADANDRERAWLATTAAWVAGETDKCVEIHNRMAAEWPRDLLAIKLGQLHAFNRGDARCCCAGRAPAAPIPTIVSAMHAFGLEECNRIDEAETLAARRWRSTAAIRGRITPSPIASKRAAGWSRARPSCGRCPTRGRAATPSCTPIIGGTSRCS